jgi:hypothetical protein
MSVSSATHALVSSLPSPAGARPAVREAAPGLAVLSILLAAIVWAAVAQVRSAPSAADLGPEAAEMGMIVD